MKQKNSSRRRVIDSRLKYNDFYDFGVSIKRINLEDGWFIRKINPVDRLDERMIAECEGGSAEELPARMPAQVHEILLRHGKIKDPAVMGNPEKCRWVAEMDWIYKINLNTANLNVPRKGKRYC